MMFMYMYKNVLCLVQRNTLTHENKLVDKRTILDRLAVPDQACSASTCNIRKMQTVSLKMNSVLTNAITKFP